MKLGRWSKNWSAITGHTGIKREDGTELRYFPSVHFGGSCSRDSYDRKTEHPGCLHTGTIHINGSLDECEAAARLISAAPDGHELLTYIRDRLQRYGEFQRGPHGRDADLMDRLAAYFRKVEGGS